MLTAFKGTDGIKTGYIGASGFNLVASTERDGVRLIGVVFGGKTSKSRDLHMIKLLTNQFDRVKPFQFETTPITVPLPRPENEHNTLIRIYFKDEKYKGDAQKLFSIVSYQFSPSSS